VAQFEPTAAHHRSWVSASPILGSSLSDDLLIPKASSRTAAGELRDLPEPLQLELLDGQTFDTSAVLHVYKRK
jgi:hypothetical protein